MPSKRKSRKLAEQTSLILSLVAGITINLVTNWFQMDILSNAFLFVIMMVALAAVGYYVIKKMRSPFITTAFIILVVSVFFNLFSSWLQVNVLHNSFTVLEVSAFLLITIVILALSGILAIHPISYAERKLRRLRKENARGEVHFASEGSTRRRQQNRRRKKR